MQLPNFKAMYQDMAKGLGGRLMCEECGRVQPCSRRGAAGYLARGWPMCCGYTMTLVTASKEPEGT